MDDETSATTGPTSSAIVDRLALLTLLGAVGLILQGFFTGLNEGRNLDEYGTHLNWTAVAIVTIATGGNIITATLVSVALALAVGFGTETSRPLGRWVISAVSVIGVVVSGLALWGLQKSLAQGADRANAFGGPSKAMAADVPLQFATAAAAYLPAAALALGSAYLAWRWLQQHPGPPEEVFVDPLDMVNEVDDSDGSGGAE